MKTILVPTDFSDHALYALKVAASIAKKTNAQIRLVHMYNFPSSELIDEYNQKDCYDQIKSMAETKLSALAKINNLKGITVSKEFVDNMYPWELASNNKYKNVDLIVIGAHGKRGHHKVFIGSNADKIIRMATAPVLTIKKEHKGFNIKSIVFASDFHEESYTVFNKIKFFTDLYKTHIYLLKVITPKDFEPTPVSKKLIEQFIQKFNLKNSTINIYNATSIEKGIIDFGDEKKADLIAIETHGKTGIAHIINGSLAEDIANHEDRPVISIKIKENPEYNSKKNNYPIDYENWGSE